MHARYGTICHSGTLAPDTLVLCHNENRTIGISVEVCQVHSLNKLRTKESIFSYPQKWLDFGQEFNVAVIYAKEVRA